MDSRVSFFIPFPNEQFQFDRSVLASRITHVIICFGEAALNHVSSRLPNLSTPKGHTFDHIFRGNTRLHIVGRSKSDEAHNMLYGGNPVIVYNIESALLDPRNHCFEKQVFTQVLRFFVHQRSNKTTTKCFVAGAPPFSCDDMASPLEDLLLLAHSEKRRNAITNAFLNVPPSSLCLECLIHLRNPTCKYCEPSQLICSRVLCGEYVGDVRIACGHCYSAIYCSWECAQADWNEFHSCLCSGDKPN